MIFFFKKECYKTRVKKKKKYSKTRVLTKCFKFYLPLPGKNASDCVATFTDPRGLMLY